MTTSHGRVNYFKSSIDDMLKKHWTLHHGDFKSNVFNKLMVLKHLMEIHIGKNIKVIM
jgi:hypothetical protein